MVDGEIHHSYGGRFFNREVDIAVQLRSGAQHVRPRATHIPGGPFLSSAAFDLAWLAVYDIQDKRFYVLSAIVQPPYYVEGSLPSLNYDGLGILLATAVSTELFFKSTTQAASSSEGNFLARSLGTMRASKQRLAGKNESRTDALAARVAHLSYHMSDDFRDAPTVQGLDIAAPDHPFFIGVAQTLCSLTRSRHYTHFVGQRMLVAAPTAINNALFPLSEKREAFNCDASNMHT
ncbi:hypothetical protein HPB51_011194 [Rhipicephalus microplus]|uniref:Uncharacterized protein n=1 Tax=Rhipicephalus microplus TaxID=6941 RepID=A0A9J6F1A6_RHIMP|nr:hypothetical protein HPB51_011194 [Rhipicephalus microplus]